MHYMVDNTNERPRPGRPPEYNRDEVVARAMVAFWSKGFETTTLVDLERVASVDRSTLYGSFGGKKGLYESTADAYSTAMNRDVVSILRDGGAGLDDVVAFLDRVATDTQSGNYPAGCFMFNCLASAQPPAAVSRYLDALASGLQDALRRAAAAGEVTAASVDERAQALLAAIVGYNTTLRSAEHRATALAMMDGTKALVRSWNT